MKYTLKTVVAGNVDVDIPDGTTEVAGVIVSGDEVLVYPVFRDPAGDGRMMDFMDDYFHRIFFRWAMG